MLHLVERQSWGLFAHSDILLSCIGFLPMGRHGVVPSWSRESLSSGSSLVQELFHLRSCLSWVSHMWWLSETKVGPFWSHAWCCWWAILAPELPARLARLYQAHIMVWLPILHSLPSFYWCQFLRNILYLKLCLEPASRKEQYTTHSFLSPHSTLAPGSTNKPPALKFDYLKETLTRARKKEENGPSLISLFLSMQRQHSCQLASFSPLGFLWVYLASLSPLISSSLKGKLGYV